MALAHEANQSLSWSPLVASPVPSIAAATLARLDKAACDAKQGPYFPNSPLALQQKASDEASSSQYPSDSKSSSKKIRLTDALSFPVLYWLLALNISLFYIIVFSFMADSGSFLTQPKFGLVSNVFTA